MAEERYEIADTSLLKSARNTLWNRNNLFGDIKASASSWWINALLVHAVRCDASAERIPSYDGALPLKPGADEGALHKIFLKYASAKKNDVTYMTCGDFIQKFLGLYQDENYNRETVELLAKAADTSKDGLISFEEFREFEAILNSPDALYRTAFEIFNRDAARSVTCSEFERVIRHTKPETKMDFNFNSPFMKRYFGPHRKRLVNYRDFCQLLDDFYDEQALQAFKKHDQKEEGMISLSNFQRIMKTVKQHLLTGFVENNLVPVSSLFTQDDLIPYAHYKAFNGLLSKMDLIKHVYLSIARGNLQMEVTKENFLSAAQTFVHITPYEVEILFKLAEAAHPGKLTLSSTDIEQIDPMRFKRVSYITRLTNLKAVETKEDRGMGVAALESLYRFIMGSVAGACGATAVYPIDLVKTRMQNQRTSEVFVGQQAYRNSWDCFRKVIKYEGVFGLYRGLLPQIVGVAPEKAIKLTVNDFVRDKFTMDGRISLWSEILAGGCGGASQVVFTNPLEIVKIRLQVAGEVQGGPRVGVATVVKELGLFGLYKGAKACFLRDIPFSAIYFPVYAHSKSSMADPNGHNSPLSLFCSAFLAGVPSAALVTPADVIKTRLQVAARKGQTTYDGLFDCARKIMKEEGPKAFWKGSVARVCRSSPQFAFTLLTYELLQRIFYVDFGGVRPAGSDVPVSRVATDPSPVHADHIGGYKLAAATFSGIEHKFGLFMPRYQPAQ